MTHQPKFWATVPPTLLAIPLVVSCAKTVLELGVDGGSPGTGGEVGGGAGSSAGGAGGQTNLPPPTNVMPWSGNPSDCPQSPPTGAPRDAYSGDPNPDLGDSICEVGELETCAYHYLLSDTPSFEDCTCYEQNRSTKRWVCTVFRNAGQDQCPAEQPAAGADCFGYVGLTCPYAPSHICSCRVKDPSTNWSCVENVIGLPDSINHSPPPDTSAATKRIADLTDAEAHAWCAWYSTFGLTAGAPAPLPSPVSADGYVTTGLNVEWDFFGDACRTTPLAEDQCVQNLELLHCQAALSELTDCVMTIMTGMPQPHGCGRFFEAANCDGTIVRRAPLASFGEGGYAGGLNPDHSVNCGSLRVR